MTAPKGTLWTAEPWTLAKHAILRRYLAAWFPILASRHGRLVYLDGFAGPGRYADGEEGSPLIALTTARNQFARLQASQLKFVFAEERRDRASHLRSVEIPALRLPGHFDVQVREGSFQEALFHVLEDLDRRGLEHIPTFAFVDPFGISGTPFRLLSRLLRRPHCEVLVTFMTHTVQRFVTELPAHVGDLIGQEDAARRIASATDRVSMARQLYSESLSRVAKFSLFFSMKSASGALVYDLFFATNHILGFERMKEAMWDVDQSGAFAFSASLDPNQLVLLGPQPGVEVARWLTERFARQRTDWDEIATAVVGQTTYLRSHARDALRLLEQGGHGTTSGIQVAGFKRDGRPRRRGTFPPGTIIQFP